MLGWSRKARDTVDTETLSLLAISLMVGNLYSDIVVFTAISFSKCMIFILNLLALDRYSSAGCPSVIANRLIYASP